MLLTGCVKSIKVTEKEDFLKFYGKKIDLPKTSSTKRLKIVSFYRGHCSSCIEDLKFWRPWVDKFNNDVDFIMFYTASDTTAFKQIVISEANYIYPIIKDTAEIFLKRNDLKDKSKNFRTFLLNEENRIILLGNPRGNLRLTELYRKQIENLTRDEDI
jgi:hypothetical protein